MAKSLKNTTNCYTANKRKIKPIFLCALCVSVLNNLAQRHREHRISQIFLFFCFLLSCNNSAPTGVIQSSSTKTEETNPFILGSQKIVELENEDIELFLKRYKWEMVKTATGLRYEITKKGNGKNFETGDPITLEYQTFLLDGTEIYNSRNDGLKQFVVEKSAEIAGLHEVALKLNKGAEARLIIPSHLAYSASGDGNRVEPYRTVVMKVKVVIND